MWPKYLTCARIPGQTALLKNRLKSINKLLDKGKYVIETLAKFATMTRQTFSKYLKLHPELEAKRAVNLPRNQRGG